MSSSLLALPFGLSIGVALGLFGGGGSVLVVPVLVYVLGQDAQEATTASLVIVTVAALVAGLRQASGGNVCWAHAAAFLVPALPAIYAGTALGESISGSALIALFAIFMLFAAYAMWRRGGSSPRSERNDDRPCPAVRASRDGAIGLLVGFMTGLFGVGGGFIIVPALAIVLALSMRAAVGTSLVIITATGLLGIAAHLLSGRTVDPDTTVAMTASMATGALAGSGLGQRVSQEALTRGFAALIVAVAVYLLFAAAFLGSPPAS